MGQTETGQGGCTAGLGLRCLTRLPNIQKPAWYSTHAGHFFFFQSDYFKSAKSLRLVFAYSATISRIISNVFSIDCTGIYSNRP